MTDLKAEIYHAAKNPIIINIFNDDELRHVTREDDTHKGKHRKQTQKTNIKTSTENEP